MKNNAETAEIFECCFPSLSCASSAIFVLPSLFSRSAMSMLASSSRAILGPSIRTPLARTVVHHARPPRQPALRAPQTPRPARPTVGTSHPDGSTGTSSSSQTQTVTYPRSAAIEGTAYTLHHAPPPSAPSYTNGTLPPFLQWCQGNTVSLTGEEQARLRKERRKEIEGGLGWDEEMLAKMRQMRADGMTRRQVGEA